MIKWLLGFLFGKQAEIFDKTGRVEHDLGSPHWQAWDDRLKSNPDYNWRDHKGRQPKLADRK